MIYKKQIVVLPQDFKDDFEKAIQDEFVKDGQIVTTWSNMQSFLNEWLEDYTDDKPEIPDEDFTGAGDILGQSNDR